MSADMATILRGEPIMAILRNMDPQRSVEIANRAWDLGIGLVEVPIQTPDALGSLAAVVRAGAERGKAVGSGTVISAEQVHQSIDLGVAFTVAPGLDGDIVKLCVEAGVAHLPGVATSSEIQAALRLGCTVVKAFPASVLGVEWFKAMGGPFPGVSFVATGGIDAANAESFLMTGVSTVALGSALADERQLDAIAHLVSWKDA